LVVHVIGRANKSNLSIFNKTVQHNTSHVAVFRTSGHIGITEPPLVHAFLYGQVEHRLLLTVVNTGDTCQIGLLVVGFQLLYHIYRQILQTGLYVSTKELLPVDHNLRQVLTVDFHIPLVINLRTGQLLHQLFEHGSLGGTISRGIIDQCIFHHLHLRRFCRNHSLGQHHRIRFQCQGTHVLGGCRGIKM